MEGGVESNGERERENWFSTEFSVLRGCMLIMAKNALVSYCVASCERKSTNHIFAWSRAE